MRVRWLLSLALALAAGQASAADTLRCGSQLVSVGDRSGEVLQKCGEPVSRDLLGYKKAPTDGKSFRSRNGPTGRMAGCTSTCGLRVID